MSAAAMQGAGPADQDLVRVRIEVREVAVFARTVRMPRARLHALQAQLADCGQAEETAEAMFEDLVADREDDRFEQQQAMHARLWPLAEGEHGEPDEPGYPRLVAMFVPGAPEAPSAAWVEAQMALDGLEPRGVARPEDLPLEPGDAP